MWGQVEAHLRGDLGDLGERRFEVALDVVAEGLERRDVETESRRWPWPPILGVVGVGLAEARPSRCQGEEGGEGLAGAGGGGDEDVAAGADVGPAGGLRVGGGVEGRRNQVWMAGWNSSIGEEDGWWGMGDGGSAAFGLLAPCPGICLVV